MSRDKSKSIALLHYAGPPIVGGVESVMRHHAQLMSEAGHQVRIIAGRGETVGPRIPFHPVPAADSLHPDILAAKEKLDAGVVPDNFDELTGRLEAGLREALRGVDILFAHNVCTMNKNLALTAALRRIGAAGDGPRLVAWHHDIAWTAERYRKELHEGWPWSLVGEAWHEAPMVHVAVSDTRRTELCSLLGLTEEDVRVIPSGLDVGRFHKLDPMTAELVRALPLIEADPLLLLPVRITRRKNIELAIRITAELGARMPGAVLVVTGPPGAHNTTNTDYFDELLALRSRLRLDPASQNGTRRPQVFFLAESAKGFLPDEVIGDLFFVADALLIPSFDEGFGIPLIEAGLAGIPVYCSDIGPFREIAQEFATYFKPDAEPAAVAGSIADYFATCRPHGLRQRVRRTYSWNALYQNAISPLLEDV